MGMLYWFLTLGFAGALLLLLKRPGLARPTVVWGLAALLPLLAALAGAIGTQARAARTLAGYSPQPTVALIINGSQVQTAQLNARAAACVERAMRLRSRTTLITNGIAIPLQPGTKIEGRLPPREVVEALTLRGELHCPDLRAAPEPEE